MRQGRNDTTQASRSGNAAEELAARFLAAQGLRVVERNFRVRGGEIDLVCRDGRVLVFVEVRLRSRNDYGSAAESITAGKRRRLILAANHYLLRHPGADARFDCVLLDRLDPAAVEWIRHAFTVDD